MSSCINNYKLSNSQLDDIKYSFRPFFGLSAVRMIINKNNFYVPISYDLSVEIIKLL